MNCYACAKHPRHVSPRHVDRDRASVGGRDTAGRSRSAVRPQDAGAAVFDPWALAPTNPRLLIVADTAVGDLGELPPLVRGVIDHAGEIHVVTPTLPGRLDWLASETNSARHAADERLDSLLGQMRSIGADVSGRTGDENILTAFADAVAEFQPDHILIALRSSEHANWQERGVIAQVRKQFELPLTTFALDDCGHVVTRKPAEPARGRIRGTAEEPDEATPEAAAESPGRTDEREPDGTPVLALFLVASLIMVAGVAFAAAVDSWWILLPVVAVDFILIVGVMLSIWRLLEDRTPPDEHFSP